VFIAFSEAFGPLYARAMGALKSRFATRWLGRSVRTTGQAHCEH
jgi:hypothetical protein